MRWYVSIGAVLIACAIAGGDVASVAAPHMPDLRDIKCADSDEAGRRCRTHPRHRLSYSMDMDELAVQREGYAQAIVSKEFLQALKSAAERQDRHDLFRMGGLQRPEVIIPWRLIDGPETADAVANEIMKTPVRRASRTSISGAIYFAMPLFEQIPITGCAA